MKALQRSSRALLTMFVAAVMILSYAGTATASGFDVTVQATGGKATYSQSANTGQATYTIAVSNPTTVAEVVSPSFAATVPAGAKVTGVSATAVDAAGQPQEVTPGAISGSTYVIDSTSIPAKSAVTYTVTMKFAYSGTPSALSCADGGGLQSTTTLLVGEHKGNSASACIDAPEKTTTTSTAPQPDSQSTTESQAPTQSDPQPQPAPQNRTAPQTQAAPAPSGNPVGSFNSWVNSDGLIYFSGWAYDPSDMSKAPTTMWTVNGKVAGYQVASLASPDLYAYGVFNRGVFGGLRADAPGKASVCMFVFNIGEGADQLTKCVDVTVPNANPAGQLRAMFTADGNIVVGGYAYDLSDQKQSTTVWITDNGKLAAAFVANAPSSQLNAYGIFGNHGVNWAFSPNGYGSHQICMYVVNIGWGQSTWTNCVSLTVDVNPGRDNPRGDFAISGAQGSIGVAGWAYDPNQPGTAVTTMWTVDGNAVGFAAANQPHAGVNNYLGVPGHHGVAVSLPASVGWHTVCQFVVNVGLGANAVTKCFNVQVVAPPSPCDPSARACVDLTNSITWLQVNGQITYGPVKMIAGRAGHRTNPGMWRVYWKNIDHKSSEFNGAPMPYAIFFDPAGIAFHEGSLYVTSHGCIHLTHESAVAYWNNLKVGDKVHVYGSAPYN